MFYHSVSITSYSINLFTQMMTVIVHVGKSTLFYEQIKYSVIIYRILFNKKKITPSLS